MIEPKWQYHADNWQIEDENGTPIAEMLDTYHAEGRLLAAAPALLKALQDAPEPRAYPQYDAQFMATLHAVDQKYANWFNTVRAEVLKAAGGGK